MSDSSAASQAGRIVVRCTCGKKLGAPSTAVGKAIKCPKCGQRVPVPRDGSIAPRAKPLPSAGRVASSAKSTTSRAADSTIKVVCPCGKKIRVPASGAGKKGKCPACGALFRVPEQQKKSGPPTLPREKDLPRPSLLEGEPEPSTTLNLLDEGSVDDELGGGLFGELETQSATGARSPGVVSAIKCPHCHGMIPSTAQRCPLCDNNPAKPPKVKKSKQRGGGGSMGDKLSGAGSALAALSLGTLYCCIGAAIGAAIWVGVSMAIGMAIGYEALILGILAGYGMVKGTKADSAIAGVLAAFITMIVVVVAKIAIVILVLFPQELANAAKAAAGMEVLPSPEEIAEMRREMIVEDTESELESMGHDPYARRTPQYYEDHAVVYKKHQDELDTWSDKKIIEEYERRQEESKSKFAESMEDYQRAKVAAYLAGQELEAEGVDDEAEDYFKQRAERSEVKQKEMESWSKEKFEEEFAKCEAAEEAEYNREELAGYLAEEELERLGIEDHMPAYDDRYSEIQVEKEKELESWSDQRVAAELEERDAKALEEIEEEAAGSPDSMWVLGLFFLLGANAIMSTLIAMGAAYIVGCGSFERA